MLATVIEKRMVVRTTKSLGLGLRARGTLRQVMDGEAEMENMQEWGWGFGSSPRDPYWYLIDDL
jgi:hypothetical protein